MSNKLIHKQTRSVCILASRYGVFVIYVGVRLLTLQQVMDSVASAIYLVLKKI